MGGYPSTRLSHRPQSGKRSSPNAKLNIVSSSRGNSKMLFYIDENASSRNGADSGGIVSLQSKKSSARPTAFYNRQSLAQTINYGNGGES